MATKLEQKGRKGDKILAHLTPGEIVIPRILAEDDDFRAIIADFFKRNGADLEEFIVGSGKNKINPETGYMEFGWISAALGGVVGFLIGGPAGAAIGAGAGYAGSKMMKPPELPKLPVQKPVEEMAVVREEAEVARRRERKKLYAGGRRSTILHGGAARLMEGLKKRLGE